MQFSEVLIKWYKNHHRDLPWRNTHNPYYIWLSEVILQQTRVKQGLPYYEKFVKTYPRLEDLANAHDDEVMRLWQGLGYYSRAKNMLFTARLIQEKYQSQFPETYKELLTLKGVGMYTAAAVASFAFGEQVAVLDGNVYRVLARFWGIKTNIASSKAAKEFGQLSQELVPEKESALYNQAIMEFGAMLCTPQKPNCIYCPLQTHCYAFQHQKQQELPVKIKNLKIKKRFFAYCIFEYNNEIAMKKRTEKDIWENLYDFYLEELSSIEALETFQPDWLQSTLTDISQVFRHQLTHQQIFIRFFHLQLLHPESKNALPQYLEWYASAKVEQLPKPILIANYLKKEKK